MINKLVNTNDKVVPTKWVHPSKKMFPHWIASLSGFDKYMSKPSNTQDTMESLCNSDATQSDLFNHQKFVRDYVSLNNPNRGILIYHGLGAAKTCAAVTIGENLKTKKLPKDATKKSFERNAVLFERI